MTPWLEFNDQNLSKVPETMGIFQLSYEPEKVAYVGGAYESMADSLKEFKGEGYTHFQWVKLPWEKEVFEMHCRLFHHAKAMGKINNAMHPEPLEGSFHACTVSGKPVAICEL